MTTAGGAGEDLVVRPERFVGKVDEVEPVVQADRHRQAGPSSVAERRAVA
ncbi:hypothetical protein [Pseudorhizobium banfieldiae]|nr:hypothetical protein [Pseudorhizobium banfieldiae]